MQCEGGVQDRLRGVRQAVPWRSPMRPGAPSDNQQLQSRDGRIGISDGQQRVQARGVCVRQQRRSDALISIGRRGLLVHRRGQVDSAGTVQERVGDLGVNVRARLLGCEVQRQLVGDGAQGVVRGHAEGPQPPAGTGLL